MANVAKKAILKAKLEGILTELLVKTSAENVYIDDSTTVASKLADIITELSEKAKTSDMTTAISTAINELRQEMLGDTPVEAYNTFTELAAYISEHQDAAEALTAAVGNKADKSTVEAIQATVNALGALSKLDEVGEDNLSAALKAKVNAAAEGNHSHSNKALLDTYTQTEENLKDAVEKKHSHENKTVLDGITADKVSAWDSKANVYYSAEEPANLAEGDLWVQIVD